ncbi:MAG: glycosyltransferase family 2 protein [Oscillospiraceae bacterium]|nr:glycosyltransferase family 2 protein [Oscillospiraceae bacterium]
MKLLTVTVPCYNSQDYMEKCIESLLPGGDRVEIIIIDDGSVDATGAIADHYAQKYPHIVRVIHQENGGHGEGINQGLRHAAGIYFKVVDSDDVLSEDFPAMLDTLQRCEEQGGVDLFVTNYYYVHTDGVGDRSIRFANALPQNRIFTWRETKPFRIHQLLTIHGCTFRTEVMRKWTNPLPKHVFYEDNLMVCQTLPYVRRMYYRDMDLYRYWIGRPDQSVQREVMMKRSHHQVQVTQACFAACDPDRVHEPQLKKYLRHELFILFGISILYTRLKDTERADEEVAQMWENCRRINEKWARYFEQKTPLRFLCVPGKAGRRFAHLIYRLANRVVRFC